MGQYLFPTQVNDDVRDQVLGFMAADIAAVQAINAKYRPILDRQDDDFSAAYDAMEAELSATPQLHMASIYDYGGFGKIVNSCGYADPDPDAWGGEATGEPACEILEAQKAKFAQRFWAGQTYPADTIAIAAIDRTIAAIRAGTVAGVNWG